MNLDRNIKIATEIICRYRHEKFYEIYPFSTENISGYLGEYDLKGKSVLSVGSSSDQIINSYFLGAEKITLFDINPFTEYYFNLKKAAIKILSYEEFLNFFCFYNYPKTFSRNKYAFNYDTFEKLSKFMDSNSYKFWNTLFNKFYGYKIRKNLFSRDEDSFKQIISNNIYLNKENFYILKSKIDMLNPQFINCDFSDLPFVLNSSYDYILLSNILAYMESMYYNPITDFSKDIKALINFLNDDGLIFLAYLYDFSSDTIALPYWDLIYHIDKIFNYFKEYNISLKSFDTKNFDSRSVYTDSVYILRK